MTHKLAPLASIMSLALALAACGGGGGGGSHVASTPTPTPTPTPPPTSSAVDIFQSPGTQEFAVLGSGDSLRIRYDATTNKYEVKPGGQGWKTLVDDPLSSPSPGNPNTNFVLSGSPLNESHFLIRAHYSYADPDVRYQYSNLAAWGDGQLGGFVAFGMATPANGVPVTGSATYQGMIEGFATDTYFDQLAGANVAGSIGGNINLAFNFGSGDLTGSISPTLYLATAYPLETLNFTNTVYSTGNTSFSGQFDTTLTGANSFAGMFTGPGAQELIGSFAFPYLSPIDGTAKHAEGAFIGKQ